MVTPEANLEQPLRAEIEKIAAEIKGRENSSESVPNRERVKSAVKPYLQAGTASDDDSEVEPLTEAEQKILPAYMSGEPADVRFQVEKLIDLAWHKSVKTAVKFARKSGDPLVIDALHDALTDKLYEELKQRGAVT